MSDQPRDWDRELADIDRVMAKQNTAPGTPAGPVPSPGTPRALPAGPHPVRRRSVALTWFWVALALALGVALAIWPYQRACGLQLFFYLGAIGVTALAGLLGALASWSHRRAVAHVLSLIVMGWAAVAAAREVLPRIGYATEARTWMCVAPPPARPAPAAPAPAPAPAVKP
ncbi:MAG: hypothetical protein ACTHM9_02490 [Gemmatimonadales bacterium]